MDAMLIGGHIAASYLIAKSAQTIGIPLTYTEIFGIIIAGNIIDLDFILGFINGKTGEAHHHTLTHTPLGIFLIWILINFLFHPPFHPSFLFLLSLSLHLILDDVGYWASRLKLVKLVVHPQVNWLYPITPFHTLPLITSNKTVLKNYLFKAWQIAMIEGILIICAVLVFIQNLT